MKNTLKRTLTGLIVASMILGVACKKNGDSSNPGPGLGTGAPPVTNDEHQGVKDRAAELAEEQAAALPDVTVTKKIELMSWFDLDETSPTVELFKARYGTPDEAGGKNVINLTRVSYDDRYEALDRAIMGDKSPDMFQFEERYFPWGVHINYFETIDGVIDLSGPEWDATRDYIKLFEWGGKNYTPITEINNSNSLLFYRNTIIAEQGFEDPYELWKKDEWDWDVFEDMVRQFSDPTNNKYGIMGFGIDEAAILTTGIGIITIEDSKLKNNMFDAKIERATDLLKRLSDGNYRYPYHTLSDFQLNPAAFRAGEVLFWQDGPWVYQERIKNWIEPDKWEDGGDEIGIVPFPRDPMADKYYQRGKQDAMMLVAGSKNKDGYIAWNHCAAIANNDTKMDAEGRDKLKKDYNWTEHQLTVLDEIRNMELVWDFKNGIGPDVSDYRESPIEDLTKPLITHGEVTYAQQRSENQSKIETRIDMMNEKVS
ncbi:MAG: ABC transporter substrate-binding protein [Oscillospiraceae bacterium]|nr:ABC transporter substrate-binding protein [Oscillospiraceae bacterium]